MDKADILKDNILAESVKLDDLDIDKIYTINRKLKNIEKQDKE